MSQRGGWGGYYNPPPRKQVQGGVVVAKPGKVTDPTAQELITAAEVETSDKIMARGRTYARAGQVVAVQSESEAFLAQIQGTGRRPYQVRLDRVVISGSDRIAADCTCPYGCDYGWCKHAAALAYVAAFLLDHDPAMRATWSGTPSTEQAAGEDVARPAAEALSADDFAVLRTPIPQINGQELLARAEMLVPHPWRPNAATDTTSAETDQ